MKYFVSCSFGKDSIATALLALEKGEPIDGLIFCEVMYDHSRNISGEIPEHINWIRKTAIPRLEEMGLKTTIVKGTFSRTITGAQLRRIYDLLEDEERPYEANVRTVKDKKKRLLSMRIRPEDKIYFQELVKTVCDEIKK